MGSPTTTSDFVTANGSSTYSGTIGGLASSTTYYVQFQYEINAGAQSSWCVLDSGTTSGTVPATPGTPAVTAKTDTTINTSWSAVSGATGYKLYYGLSNNPTSPGSTQSGTTKSFSGLSAATTYYFRIKAYNSAGDSAYSGILVVDTTTVTPSIPVASSNVDPTEQVITWPTPTGTYYSYLYGTGNNSTSQLQAIAASSVETHTQVTTPGSTYYYRTRTVTTNHNSLYSAYSPQLTAVAASVAVPTSFGYTATSTTTITFNWTNPTYSDRTYFAATGGTPYSVNNPDYVTGTTRLIGDGDTIMGTAISIGQNTGYSFVARNYYDGHYSAYTSTFTGYTLPGPPTSVTATDLSDTQIQLSWTDPAGSALSETFTIDYRIDNTGSWINATTTATGTSYVHSGLTQGTHYYYQIKTVTSAGSSTYATANDTTQTGPDPVAGDALGLGQLGYATGVNGNATTLASMQACNGGATTEVSFKDFYTGAVGTLSGVSAVWKGSTATFTANFSNKGTLFDSRIGIEDGNFTWSSSNTAIATVESNADRTCLITTTNAGGTATISMAFAGRYNSHSSIPSPPASVKTKTITAVG
jgi:titin